MAKLRIVSTTCLALVFLAAGAALAAPDAPQPEWSRALNQAVANIFAGAFEQMANLIFAVILAGPALASMLLLWISRHWPFLQRSIWVSAIISVVLTLACGFAAGAAIMAGRELVTSERDYLAVQPYLAMALIVVAAGLHIRAPSAFSQPR